MTQFNVEYVRVGDSQCLLSESSIECPSGSKIGILGSNGAGKTVLLHLMADEYADERMSLLRGLDWDIEWQPEPPTEPGNGSIGFVNQIPHENIITRRVKDEMYFSLLANGTDYYKLNEEMNDKAETLNASGLLERESTGLSEGEAQSVSLMEALSRECQLLFLDEPTAHLDSDAESACLEAICEFHNNNQEASIVMSSHDSDLLFDICDKVYKIENENLVELNSPPEQTHLFNSLLGDPNDNPDTSILHAENLECWIDGDKIINDFELELDLGSISVIVGDNGAGKSSLLRTLAGLARERSRWSSFRHGLSWAGKLEWKNKPITQYSSLWPHEIYMVFQDPTVHFSGGTVQSDLKRQDMFCNKIGIDDELPSEIKDVFNKWDIQIETPTYSLSYGQAKILSLIPALLEEPDLLLIDSPFVGLSPELCQDVIEILENLYEDGTAICAASHDPDQVWTDIDAQVVPVEASE